MPQSVVVVLLLGASLVALLLVQFARKEAAAERESARRDTDTMRQEARAMMADAQRREERVAQREKELAADQRNAQTYARSLEERVSVIARDEKRLQAERDKLAAEHREALAAVSGLSPQQAEAKLVEQLKERARLQALADLRRIEKRAQAQAAERSTEIMVAAMQRQAAATTAHNAVTWMALPSEEMKGRIIGREGRNIRTFEALTGVNLLVDEDATGVQLSSFDVERREIAQVTLQALMDDGRIQPPRIEAAYAAAVAGAADRHLAAGLDAMEEAKVEGVPEEMIRTLGALRLRTSYGQMVLSHLVECAQIAGDIARELGADVDLARRGAFLHDIGKAFTSQHEGTHAALGADFARRHGESEAVVNAIAAHHDEVEHLSLESVIVQVADAISASRPGARREELDSYIERLGSLEDLVGQIEGVSSVVAMSAGREVRVVVKPEDVPDADLPHVARRIAQEIHDHATIPGEVNVTVIRETRAQAVAGEA